MDRLEVPHESRRAFSAAYESPAEELDDLVAIRAIAAPVVAAYLRRLAEWGHSITPYALRNCADELEARR